MTGKHKVSVCNHCGKAYPEQPSECERCKGRFFHPELWLQPLKKNSPTDVMPIRAHRYTVERLKNLGKIGDSVESVIIELLNIGEPILLKRRQKEAEKLAERLQKEEMRKKLEEMESRLPQE